MKIVLFKKSHLELAKSLKFLAENDFFQSFAITKMKWNQKMTHLLSRNFIYRTQYIFEVLLASIMV